MIGTITKTCNKCKKVLSLDMFRDNERGECFENCDACSSRGRDKHSRARIPRQEAKCNASLTCQDVVKSDELVDSTAISLSNKNLFVEGLSAYIVQELPDMRFEFVEPKSARYCITMFFHGGARLVDSFWMHVGRDERTT